MSSLAELGAGHPVAGLPVCPAARLPVAGLPHCPFEIAGCPVAGLPGSLRPWQGSGSLTRLYIDGVPFRITVSRVQCI